MNEVLCSHFNVTTDTQCRLKKIGLKDCHHKIAKALRLDLPYTASLQYYSQADVLVIRFYRTGTYSAGFELKNDGSVFGWVNAEAFVTFRWIEAAYNKVKSSL